MMNNAATNRTPAFEALAPTRVKPGGWLAVQLRLQAEGLAGNLDRIWPDVRDSRWIGGPTDGWERVPYWLDGFIPLAWLCDDASMKQRATRYIDEILARQQPDGWICPTSGEDRSRYDLWAMFLVLKVLTVWHDATRDPRVEPAVEKALQALDRHIDGRTLFDWAQTRWFECLIPILWLHERKGGSWLPQLAVKLRAQGFDWNALFADWPYRLPDAPGRWSQMSHVVNNAMMLKEGALSWRLDGDRARFDGARRMLRMLDAHHGMITGVFTGDECLAGLSPVRGTELCAVAELMYSLEHLLLAEGDTRWADRLERVAFNALPATFGPDMWTHQYDQQVNQVQCTVQETSPFGTNGGDAHTFGLEPNFGCCTANMGQAWPKLALHALLRQTDAAGETKGVVVAMPLPVAGQFTIDGRSVSVAVETAYPFREQVTVHVRTDVSVRFPLLVRIPAWAQDAALSVGGVPQTAQPVPGTFHRIDRVWEGDGVVELRLPMRTRLVDRLDGMAALERGPLVFSMAIGEQWRRIHEDMPGRELPHGDWEVLPTTAWNRGFDDALTDPEVVSALPVDLNAVAGRPFSPDGAPIALRVPVHAVEWPLVNGSAAPVPSGGRLSSGPEFARFIPYGCTNLRLTELPAPGTSGLG